MGYHKTTNLGLETPEAGNSPAITGDLQKLANQVDAAIVGSGPWIPLTPGSNVEIAGGGPGAEAAVRSEQHGAVARLRGALRVKSGHSQGEGGTLATLPEALVPPELAGAVVPVRPAEDEFGTAQNLILCGLIITSVLALAFFEEVELDAKARIFLDGVTWNLT